MGSMNIKEGYDIVNIKEFKDEEYPLLKHKLTMKNTSKDNHPFRIALTDRQIKILYEALKAYLGGE